MFRHGGIAPRGTRRLHESRHHYDRGGDKTENQDALVKPLGLSVQEKADLKTFLESLWGQHEKETIDVNVYGFAAMANVAAEHLQARGGGHIVGVSSVAALRGSANAPAYNASKAFMSNYLKGL